MEKRLWRRNKSLSWKRKPKEIFQDKFYILNLTNFQRPKLVWNCFDTQGEAEQALLMNFAHKPLQVRVIEGSRAIEMKLWFMGSKEPGREREIPKHLFKSPIPPELKTKEGKRILSNMKYKDRQTEKARIRELCSEARGRIERKPKTLFKRILPHWEFEIFTSYSLSQFINPDSATSLGAFRTYQTVHHLFQTTWEDKKIINYKAVNQVMHIMIGLNDEYFNEISKYSQGLDVALWVHSELRESLDEYLKEKRKVRDRPYHTQQEAFKEQVIRGFVPQQMTELIRSRDYYITSILTPLVYPVKVDSFEQAEDLRRLVGIMGYTGINDPNQSR